METKDLNNIGLAYLQVLENINKETKKKHAKTLDKVNPDELDGDHDERDDKDIDNDGDVDKSDEYLHNRRKAVKKAMKKDSKVDDQEEFKAYNGKEDADLDEKAPKIDPDKFAVHMNRNKKPTVKTSASQNYIKDVQKRSNKMARESVEIDEAMDSKKAMALYVKRLQQKGAVRQSALAKGLMDYSKKIGKDHMDYKDFMDHAKVVKAGNFKKAKAHADDQDTEVREKIHSLAIKHLGQEAASALYADKGKMMKINPGDGKLHASYEATIPDGQTVMTKKPELTKKDKKTMGKIADLMKTANESIDVVLALIDQGYTLDQAEAMVAEASCGRVNASVRPGTKQNQRDFDKAARMAKPKDKVSLKPMPAALAKKMKDEDLEKEGNMFTKALMAARKNGDKTFVVGTKSYNTEDYTNKMESSDLMARISSKIKNIQEEKNNLIEVASPTAIHHSTPVSGKDVNSKEAEDRRGDRVSPGNMTEKEFLDIHAVPTEVDPAFDGNIAADKTAEAIKSAPTAKAAMPNNPNGGDTNIIKSTEAPAQNAMENYAAYIKGKK